MLSEIDTSIDRLRESEAYISASDFQKDFLNTQPDLIKCAIETTISRMEDFTIDEVFKMSRWPDIVHSISLELYNTHTHPSPQ